MPCPECEKLKAEIEGLKDALIMREVLSVGEILAKGDHYKVIKVKHLKRAGFTLIEDEDA
jgi:uncharacterized Zn ribbon protein